MSMKPIEMQFALHKNDEVGLKQHQLQHKPLQDQAILSDATDKKTEKDRHISSKTAETAHSSIRDEGKDSSHSSKGRKRNSKASTDEKDAPAPARTKDHPFKGHHIDLSL